MDTQRHTQKWAPVVHACTLTAEHRYIAVPIFFQDAQLKSWATRHILAARNYQDLLTNGPRLSIFQNRRCRVFGITTRAKHLVSPQSRMLADEKCPKDRMLADEKCRPIWGFFGFAARCDDNGLFPGVPSYATCFTMLGSLYKHVRAHWTDPDRSSLPDYLETEFVELAPAWWAVESSMDANQGDSAPIELNDDPRQIFLYPDSYQSRVTLWQAALRCNTPISLCLGLAFGNKRREARESMFLNATVGGIAQGGEHIEKNQEVAELISPTPEV